MYEKSYVLVVMDSNPFITDKAKINRMDYRFATEFQRRKRQQDEERRGRYCITWNEYIPNEED